MGEQVVWCDGRFRADDEPLVGALDRTLTGGLGVYESCAVLDGRVFAPTRHLARLTRSAAQIGLPAPQTGELREALDAVAARGAWSYGRLRITLTSGAADGEPGTAIVVGGPARAVERVRVVRAPWVRNERSAATGAKVTSTAENLLAARWAREQGADEAVLANTRGELCECTTSNVLVEVDEELRTPPLAAGCLGGVTRALLLAWAPELGLPVREATMAFEVLDDVAGGRAAMAVSSTLRTVVPVVALDGRATKPAVLATRARQLFDARRRDEIDPV